jgi:hypothetical protein
VPNVQKDSETKVQDSHGLVDGRYDDVIEYMDVHALLSHHRSWYMTVDRQW